MAQGASDWTPIILSVVALDVSTIFMGFIQESLSRRYSAKERKELSMCDGTHTLLILSAKLLIPQQYRIQTRKSQAGH